MENLKDFETLQEMMEGFDLASYQLMICKNIKRIRKEKYVLYKKNNGNQKMNPYSSKYIAELLDVSYEYYRRLESYDPNKSLSLKLFLKLFVILEVDIQEFLRF